VITGFEKAACVLSIIGFIAAVVAVIILWVRNGTPISDAEILMQPLYVWLCFTGVMAFFLISSLKKN